MKENKGVPQESEIGEMVKNLCDDNRLKHEEIRKKLVSYGSISLKYVPDYSKIQSTIAGGKP